MRTDKFLLYLGVTLFRKSSDIVCAQFDWGWLGSFSDIFQSSVWIGVQSVSFGWIGFGEWLFGLRSSQGGELGWPDGVLVTTLDASWRDCFSGRDGYTVFTISVNELLVS
jgi:hypothetical protein